MNFSRVRFCIPVMFLLTSGIVMGCRGAPGPEIAPVDGVVTLDGKPIEGAGVTFEPVGEGRSSFALTDAAGRYELVYMPGKKGAMVGEHVVRISKSRKSIKDDNGKVIEEGVPEAFPAKVNSSSELKAAVKPGANHLDFAVTK